MHLGTLFKGETLMSAVHFINKLVDHQKKK